MSATNHTTNYELPIFVGTDKPAWLVDWNGAMTAIDTAIHTAEGKADQAGTDIGGIESSISTINSTLTSINSAVSQLRLDTNANTGSINTIQELIGNGTPTTTDKTLIGAINELKADLDEGFAYSSTDEEVIGTWNGKPLYRKVFEYPTFASADSVWDDKTPLSNTCVIRFGSSYLMPPTGDLMPLTFASSTTSIGTVSYNRNGSNGVVGHYTVSATVATYGVRHILAYTKTTD